MGDYSMELLRERERMGEIRSYRRCVNVELMGEMRGYRCVNVVHGSSHISCVWAAKLDTLKFVNSHRIRDHG